MPRLSTRALAAIILLLWLPASSGGAEAVPARVTDEPRPRDEGRRLAPGIETASRAEEARIARCSRAFLDCAGKGRAAMDVCIVGIPTCAGNAGAPCCPSACTRRYAALRRDGASHPEAVHAALFPAPGATCAELP